MPGVAMKSRILPEAIQLLRSPLFALKEIRQMLTDNMSDEDRDAGKKQGRILIDKEGNATLNLENDEVKAELRRHIEALDSVIVAEPTRTEDRRPEDQETA